MVDSLLPPERGAAGSSRRGRRRDNRLARTIVLGTIAVAFALYWLGRSFGVDFSEMLDYLLTSFLFVAIPTLLAVLGGSVLWLIKRAGGYGRSVKKRSNRGR